MNSSKIIRILLILVSILWLVVVVYREYKISQKKLYPFPTPIITSTPIPTPDFANDWKSYNDAHNSFSIKYPSDFTFSEYKEGNYNGFQLSFIGPTQIASGRTQTSLFDGAVIKGLVINEEEATALTLAQTMRARETNVPEGEKAPALTDIKPVRIGNTRGFQYTSEGTGKAQITFVQIGDNVLQLVSIYAGTPDSEPQYLAKINQILSTLTIK